MTDVSHQYNGITIGGRLIVFTLICLVISSLLQWLVIALSIAIYIGRISTGA